MLEKIYKIIEKNEFMNLRGWISEIVWSKNIDFNFDPVAHYTLKVDWKKMIITNKNNVDIAIW